MALVAAAVGSPAVPARAAGPPGPVEVATTSIGAAGAVSAAAAQRDADAGPTDAPRRVRSSVDPLEPLNRGIAIFNDTIDAALVRPVARVYDRYTPEVVRLIVGNVLSNFLDPWIAVNNFLQGKPADGFSDVGRFLFNSTFGFFGFGDPASDIGLPKHREDFGQTLGVWGVPQGPFLMLPLLGPSTVRDTVGFSVDAYGALVSRIDNVPLRNSLAGVQFVETRARLLPADRLLEDALDRYLLIRDGYLQRRRNLVYDGDPPDDEDRNGTPP
jgi:phospholipid-binding lipoprotein MlaA